MAASKLADFEVGQILALHRKGYAQRDIADSAARADPEACAVRLVRKRLTRLSAALFAALQKSEQGGVFYSEWQYYGGSRLVRLVKSLKNKIEFNSLRI